MLLAPLPRSRVRGLERRVYHVALLFCPSLSAVGVALDPTCFRRICRIETWWFVLRHHQDLPQDGALVVGGDVDPNLIESPPFGDMGVRVVRGVSCSWSIFFRNRQPRRVCRAPL
jgi:hypothetical protein